MGQTDITSCEIRKVEIHIEELFYNREDTDSLLKILDSTYVKACLEQIAANATKLNYEDRTQLLMILKDFDNFVGVSLR